MIPVILFCGVQALIIAGYFILRSQVVKLPSPTDEFGIGPFFHNLRTIPEYIAKFFIPLELAPMSGFTVINTLIGVLLMIALIVLAWKYSPRPYTTALFGLAWFFIFVTPGVMYSHTLGSAAYDYLEHRAYLPLMGIMILLFVTISNLPSEKIKDRLTGYILVLALVFGVYSFVYAKNYENPMLFYNHATAANPGSAMALSNRGLIKADLKDFQGAIADYDLALKVKPDYAQVYVNKGVSLSALNDKAGAIALFDTAIHYDPALFQPHYNMANLLREAGKLDEALKEYDVAVKLYPTYVACYTARGLAYSQANNPAAAEKDFSKAIELNGKDPMPLLNRGKIRYNSGNKQGACSDWQTAAGLGSQDARDLLAKYCK